MPNSSPGVPRRMSLVRAYPPDAFFAVRRRRGRRESGCATFDNVVMHVEARLYPVDGMPYLHGRGRYRRGGPRKTPRVVPRAVIPAAAVERQNIDPQLVGSPPPFPPSVPPPLHVVTLPPPPPSSSSPPPCPTSTLPGGKFADAIAIRPHVDGRCRLRLRPSSPRDRSPASIRLLSTGSSSTPQPPPLLPLTLPRSSIRTPTSPTTSTTSRDWRNAVAARGASDPPCPPSRSSPASSPCPPPPDGRQRRDVRQV
jgi:hypothetical protein